MGVKGRGGALGEVEAMMTSNTVDMVDGYRCVQSA